MESNVGHVPGGIYEFMKRMEGMSYVARKIFHQNGRRENDAEHTFQVLMMAFLLEPYYEQKIDLLRAFKMALIHDLVELIAGDTSIYEEQGDVKERERRAAIELFGTLPSEEARKFAELWQEFEEQNTAEAIFVNAVDKLQPGIMNVVTGGMSWKVFLVTREMVLDHKSDLVERQPMFRDLLRLIMGEADERNLFSPSSG
jgi:putative hydrolase of HD superfamily